MPDSSHAAVGVTVRLVYLARLREAFGRSGERVTLAAVVERWPTCSRSCAPRGGLVARARAGRAFRVAVNHDLVGDRRGGARRRRGRAAAAGHGRLGRRDCPHPHRRLRRRPRDRRAARGRPRASAPSRSSSAPCATSTTRASGHDDARALSGHDREGARGDRRRGAVRASTSSTRWSIHRVGELQPADQIVLVAVTSAHRGDAFDACDSSWTT